MGRTDFRPGQARPAWPRRLCPEPAVGQVHAVEWHRSEEEPAGEPELAVCGAIVAVRAGSFPDPAGPACPECAEAVAAG
ncbi:hypothetical protein [Modestobacter sp. NPDC049651]|uniref:hypothetical protein n=1 Tax=unclassified Modestobacter TaxID=2643866 RepID=UPI0033C71249